MWQCEKCKEYKCGGVEKCNCKPFILIDMDGEEHEINAINEREAALMYAEKSNIENDYYLMNENVEISVNDIKYSIGAEPDVHYSAKAI